VDVGPFVVADAEASELIEPGTVWPLPRSATFAVQRGNGIDQRQGFLRVVPICAGQTHGERHASAVANQMALAPALGPIGGIRTSLVTAMHCPDGTTVHDRPGPINLIVAREPIQQRKVDQIPHPRLLPVAQATPARHPRPACEFLREHLPGNAAAEDEDDAGETRTVRNARPPSPLAVVAEFRRFCYTLLPIFLRIFQSSRAVSCVFDFFFVVPRPSLPVATIGGYNARFFDVFHSGPRCRVLF